MRQDPSYRDAMNRYHKDRKSKAIKKELSDIRNQYGLSEYALHKFVKLQQKRYVADIDSLTAQKIATHVWQAAEDILFDSGKQIHFRMGRTLVPWKERNNQSGIRFRDGRDALEGTGDPAKVVQERPLCQRSPAEPGKVLPDLPQNGLAVAISFISSWF